LWRSPSSRKSPILVRGFRYFAFLVLLVVLLIGFMTFIRLGEANTDDIRLVIGMNRLRHGYLDLAPELEPYFTMGHHDDQVSILQSYRLGYQLRLSRLLGGTPALVAAINAVLVGVIAAIIAEAMGTQDLVIVAVGIIAALVAVIGHGTMMFRAITYGRKEHRSRFPNK